MCVVSVGPPGSRSRWVACSSSYHAARKICQKWPFLCTAARTLRRKIRIGKKISIWRRPAKLGQMDVVKDTLRATVRMTYDGRVFKTFRGPKAEERFDNEVKVLQHLEKRGCTFVPRLLEEDRVAIAHRHHELRLARGALGRGSCEGAVRGTLQVWRAPR